MIDYDVTGQVDEASYNSAYFDIVLISKLKERAVEEEGKGQYIKAFNTWKALKQIIYSRFTDEERKRLKLIERHILSKLAKPSNNKPNDNQSNKTISHNLKLNNIQINNNAIVGSYLEFYIQELSLLMEKYSFGIGKKEKKTRLS